MRIAVFGGSFDPIHAAHTACVLWALESGEVDAVALIPSGQHPFGKRASAAFDDRVEMVRLALGPFDAGRAWVSDVERESDGPSYMADTLRALQRRHTGCTFRLLAGSDVIADLPKWKSPDEVRRLAPPLEAPRPGTASGAGGWLGPTAELSSSMIRERLAAGEDVSGLMPAAVLKFIRERGLYGASTTR